MLGALRRLGIDAEKKGRNDAWRKVLQDWLLLIASNTFTTRILQGHQEAARQTSLEFRFWRLTKDQRVLWWFLPCFYPNLCMQSFFAFYRFRQPCQTPGSQRHKDLTYQDKKISGSAFKHAPDRQVSLHHGTILTLRLSRMCVRPYPPWVLEVILPRFWHLG